MPVVLTATHRITLTFTVDGFEHKHHAFCKRSDPLIGGPGVANRDGVTLTDVVDAMQGLWDTVREILPTSTPPAGALFEERSGLIWLPVLASSPTGSGNDPDGPHVANQATLTLRDTSFKPIRVVVLEPSEGYVFHSPSGLGHGTHYDRFVDSYNGVGFGAHDPYVWQKSRGDRYIAPTGSVAGLTLDLNDRLKRRRGLE